MKTTFYFNTGVRPYEHTPPVPIMKWMVLRGGVIQIPFECEDVPDGAIFKFASSNLDFHKQDIQAGLIVRQILQSDNAPEGYASGLCSTHAFFMLPYTKTL